MKNGYRKMKKDKTKIEKSGLLTEVFDVDGKSVEEIELPKAIFAAKVNDKLLAQAVRVYLTNQRQGTVSTKTRGEVAGSTRKIYRQKGTGRARHGSIKAPIFVGGGVVFGPKPRDFSLKMPKKMKTKALIFALSYKFKNNQILIIDSLKKLANKTKAMIKTLTNLNLETKKGKLLTKTLLITKSPKLSLAGRNIQNLNFIPVNLLNPYLILANEKIIFTKEALEEGINRWKKS